MSYTLSTPCHYCEKHENCNDERNIMNGVYKIHSDNETHRGSGMIVLMCNKAITTIKEVR